MKEKKNKILFNLKTSTIIILIQIYFKKPYNPQINIIKDSSYQIIIELD